MQKRLQRFIPLGALAIAGALLVSAQTPAPTTPAPAGAPGPAKIAFVNPVAILSSTAEGKQEFAKLQELTSTKQKQVADASTELRTLQDQYSKTNLTANPTTRAEMERQIQDKDIRLKRLQEDAQLELQQRQDDLLEKMGGKLQTVLTEYAQKNGIDTIFRLDQNQTFAYVNPALNITDAIIKQYDQRFPAPAATTAPAAAPK
ncbi:MAG: OmpH family outer membrane protein [Acidobacteria bacterium]|nr:MAG: OmpH family outer membrane protein [Acidobacteriota bacterium]